MITAVRGVFRTREQRGDLGDLVLWLGVLAVTGLVGVTAPLVGAAVDGLVIVWLALFVRSSSKWADAAAGLALVPLLRLLWLVMPIDGVAQLDWVPLVGAPFLAASLLVARTAGLSSREVGARAPIDTLLSAVAVGGWAIGGWVLATIAGDAVAWGATTGGIAWERVVLYAVLVAAAEEVAFRGVLPAVLERLVPRDGMWVATLACATLALGTSLPWWAAIAVVVAVVNGMVAARTRSLAPVIAGHAVFLVALNL